jgi:eukaryotic-like serine/threonine-protein kinase
MSPEQVEGKDLDARSDIFSLGAVLYEMVTGRRAFDGQSQLSVASAILEKEPGPINATAPLTPANVDHVIRRCLATDRDERWQTARDLASELEWLGESGNQSSSAVQPKTSKTRAWLLWLLCGVLGAALLTAIFAWA